MNINWIIGFLIVISWCKAGLADGVCRYIFVGITFIVVIQSFVYFRIKGFPSKFNLTYLVSLLFYFTLSYFNPTYNALNEDHLNRVDYHKKVQKSKNINNSEFLSKRIDTIISAGNKNRLQSLALFNDLKTTYSRSYKINEEDNLWDLIIDIDDIIKLNPTRWLPITTIKDNSTVWNFYILFTAIYFLILISCFNISFNKFRVICYVILFNSFLLSLIGIYQKINYDFDFSKKEILGIWDAPEPRYYFSTFTYKNHWCSFALLSISFGLSLLNRPIKYFGKYSYRSKEFLVIIILLSPIIFSIPLSGSRSGTLLLFICSLTIGYYYINLLIEKAKVKLYISLISFSSITILITFFILDKNNISKEMINNTKIQYNSLLDGKLPLRAYLMGDAIEVGKSAPIFGWGYNSYGSINPLFQSNHVKEERVIGLANAHKPYVPLVNHAHNDLLEWWCEWGTVGTVLFLVPLVVVLFAQLLSNQSAERKFLLLGVLVTLLYSVVDFPTRTPACLLLVSICFALGMKRSYKIF